MIESNLLSCDIFALAVSFWNELGVKSLTGVLASKYWTVAKFNWEQWLTYSHSKKRLQLLCSLELEVTFADTKWKQVCIIFATSSFFFFAIYIVVFLSLFQCVFCPASSWSSPYNIKLLEATVLIWHCINKMQLICYFVSCHGRLCFLYLH